MKPEFRILPVTKNAIRQQAWLELRLLTIGSLRHVVLLTALLCLSVPWQAKAIGLGVPLTSPVLLQPLRIDIPLLVGADETLPRNDCVHIAPAADGTDIQFFPKQAKLSVEASPKPHLRITSPVAVREPFLEFRLVLGCNGPMARDYLLLTRQTESVDESHATIASSKSTTANPGTPAEPIAPTPSEPKTNASVSAALVPVATPHPTQDANTTGHHKHAATANQLTLKRDSTLNVLARGRYPNNQATRDEYRRLMALANPGLFANAAQVGSVFLPAGTVLSIPPNLPPVERATGQAAISPPAVARPPVVTKPVAEKAATATSGSQIGTKDRLVIGGANEMAPRRLMSAKEATETIERLDQMLTAQTASENELAEKLKTLEALFTSTKSQLQYLEAKSKQQEADQRQLQAKLDAKPEPRPLGFLELMILIVTCGLIGAGLLAYSHRQRTQGLRFPSADADRNLSILEPHPIFSSASEAPETDFDEEVVPPSKSVSPPGSSTVLTWLPPDSRSAPSTATNLDAATAQVQKSADSGLSNRTANNGTDAAPASAPSRQDSPLASNVTNIVVPAPEFSSSHPSDMEFPANAPKRNSDIADIKKATTSPAAVPEIAFSLDLDSLSTPKRRAPLNDLDYPSVTHAEASSEALPALAQEVAMPFDLAWRTDAEIEAAAALERNLAAKPQAAPAKAEAPKSAEDPAVELADIMISMGMEEHAERTLIDYILEDPKRDLGPWLKALEIYRESGRREEFEELAVSLRKNLNVAPDPWESHEPQVTQSLEEFSRVYQTIQRLWPTEAADSYLGSLLGDNRDGSRAGFPQAVAEEILWLLRILRVRRETA